MSLRNAVVSLLALGVVVALVLGLTRHEIPWLGFAIYWSIGLVVMLVENGRYRPVLSGRNFVATAERYQDPVTGETIDVYVDKTTGQRDYRPHPTEDVVERP